MRDESMRIPKLFFFSLMVSSSLFAQGIKVVGTIEHTITVPQGKSLTTKPVKQQLKLLKMDLSPSALEVLNKRAVATIKKPNTLSTSSTLPGKASLGMNDVPVLNQGSHGSCVTFATTAAIDAAINKGDYVSQVCQLQLGKYLEKNGYTASGWDGSIGRLSLGQMELFGIVNKEKQNTIGCGGLTEYPQEGMPSEATEMSLEQFHQLSESLAGDGEDSDNKVVWSPILDLYQAVLERTDTNKTLNDVKDSLNKGDRVTFAILLLDFDLGFMGAVGTHNGSFDSWVLTSEIARDIYLRPFSFGGHEMVITGYDDDAVATDEQGHQHKGLLTLRNSWGDKVGDNGEFYMSYDYFKVLVIEAQRIRNLAIDDDEDSAKK